MSFLMCTFYVAVDFLAEHLSAKCKIFSHSSCPVLLSDCLLSLTPWNINNCKFIRSNWGFAQLSICQFQLYATYRDEHSAPFSWMTKSQQELRFDSGTPEGDVATSSSQLQEEESVYAEGGRGGLRAPSGRLNTSLTHGILHAMLDYNFFLVFA